MDNKDRYFTMVVSDETQRDLIKKFDAYKQKHLTDEVIEKSFEAALKSQLTSIANEVLQGKAFRDSLKRSMTELALAGIKNETLKRLNESASVDTQINTDKFD